MKIKELNTEKNYHKAINRLEEIGDHPNFENDKNLMAEFELLEKAIELYEKAKHFIDEGDPIEIIKLKMSYLDLTQKDLIPLIGSRGVVSDVLNKKRRLSKMMIRKLAPFLNLNQDILNVEYCINPRLPKQKIPIKENLFDFDESIQSLINAFSQRTRDRGMLICGFN